MVPNADSRVWQWIWAGINPTLIRNVKECVPGGAYSHRTRTFLGVRAGAAFRCPASTAEDTKRNSRCIMDTQLGIAVVTNSSHGMASFRTAVEIMPDVARVTARMPRSDDMIMSEASRLLEDVRDALDSDLGVASKAAGRLAALLASKLPAGSPTEPARGGLAPWQMRAVRNYIENQLGGPVRVADLAKLVSLSASYFSRAFKDSFGELPHAYIVRMRIERAQTLMLTTSSSLSQIAYACGLVDQAHLCRCFRQATGTTPGVWRHRHAVGRPSAAIA
jgi:AraC-like DNA-binding protein